MATPNTGEPQNVIILGNDSPSGTIGTVTQGNSNADPAQAWEVVDEAGNAILTDGTQISQVKAGAKGATTATAVTSTANGADHQGLDTVEQFASPAEDNTGTYTGQARFVVEQRNSYSNITSATTTVVKSGSGFLHKIVVNKGVASATITIYDNTSASGTKIGTITFGSSLLTDIPVAHYDVYFATGLTIVTSGATDITVSYR